MLRYLVPAKVFLIIGHVGGDAGGGTKPDIRIVGHPWWWGVQYLDGPPEGPIHHGKRDPYAHTSSHYIDPKTADVMHSF